MLIHNMVASWCNSLLPFFLLTSAIICINLLSFVETRGVCDSQHWVIFWKGQEPLCDPPTSSISDERPGGIINAVLIPALQYCCSDSPPQITYRRVLKESEILEAAIPNNPTAAVFIPATQSFFDHKFVPILKSPGSVYVETSVDNHPLFQTAEVVLQAWPLAILFSMLSVCTAMGIWLVDASNMRERFPYSITGLWRGIWWAYSTGTGSGISEPSPGTFPSQIIGIIWMVTSSIIIILFCSSIVVGLAVAALRKPLLRGKTIAVVDGTPESETAFYAAANIKTFQRASEILDLVDSNRSAIDGLLFEYFLAHSKPMVTFMRSRSLPWTEIIERPTQYGIKFVLGGDNEMLACLSAYIDLRRHDVLKVMAYSISDTLEQHENLAVKISAAVFQFLTAKKLEIIAAVILSTLVLSIVWQLCYQQKRTGKKTTRGHLHFWNQYFVPPDTNDAKRSANPTSIHYTSSFHSAGDNNINDHHLATYNSVEVDPVYSIPQKPQQPQHSSDLLTGLRTNPLMKYNSQFGASPEMTADHHNGYGCYPDTSDGMSSLSLEDGLFSRNSEHSTATSPPLFTSKLRKTQSSKDESRSRKNTASAPKYAERRHKSSVGQGQRPSIASSSSSGIRRRSVSDFNNAGSRNKMIYEI